MRHAPIGIAAALVALTTMVSASASQTETRTECPQDTTQVGERRVTEGNVTRVHPLCRARIDGPARNKAAWSTGTWRRGGSVANVLGTCYSNWSCHPTVPILRGADNKLRSTPLERHKGACSAGTNPKKCGTCMPISRPSSDSCRTCVEPKQCGQRELGWRTREKLGCCYLND